MVRFLVRRTLQSLPLLLVVSLLVFGLLHAAPGGPLAVYLANPNVRPEDVERGAADLGVEMTEHIQFIIDAMKPLARELDLERGAGSEE